ncbi:MAG: small multi-drug export protein [Anaerovoracaceae bacterium]
MITWFTTTFLGQILSTTAIAMVPVVELRGAIPYGVALGLSPWIAFIASVVGNMIPIPFIILFIRHLFEWLKSHGPFGDRIRRLEKKAHLKGRIVKKYRVIGLCLFVAIPLPGTGGWTGALIAALLDMRLRIAIPSIFVGILIAGMLVTGITYGFTSLF